MLRRIAPMLTILVCFLLDTTIIPIVYGGVFAVPLTLVAALLIGMLMGRMRGLLYGTIGGLLIDITAGTLGMMTFFFMAAGFLIGLILYNPSETFRRSRRNLRRQWIQRAVWVFTLYGIGEIALFMVQYFNTAMIQPVYFLYIALRAVICTALTILFRPVAQSILVGPDRPNRPVRNREVKSF